MFKRNVLDKSAKYNLQIFDQLMKIVKDIPPYVENENVFDNAKVFESHTDRSNLANEQKNVCFKEGLPC